jgi:hypothetical protein
MRSRRLRKYMTTNAADDTDERVADDQQASRYAELTIGDDEFVIYDRQNHRAWIQSTVTMTVDDL